MNHRKIAALIANLVLALALAITALPAQAAVPQTLNYQGQLASAGGVPVNGTVNITFSLYDVATGGTALWSETQSVTVTNGLYSVTLGQMTPLDATLFTAQRYLGITVGTDPEMTPRIALSSSATALRAAVADSIDCTGCIVAGQLEPGAVTASIPAGSITAAQLAPATVAAIAAPAGSMIMTASATPPAGYSYTGSTVTPNAWVAKAPIPTARDGATAATVNGRIYVVGGRIRDDYAIPPVETFFATNEEYDPATNIWATRAPMPTARNQPASGVVNGKIYVMGGRTTGLSQLDVNEEYDPLTIAWTTKAPMPTARAYLGGNGAAVVNGKIYACLSGCHPNQLPVVC